jgi:hypothetical protein
MKKEMGGVGERETGRSLFALQATQDRRGVLEGGIGKKGRKFKAQSRGQRIESEVGIGNAKVGKIASNASSWFIADREK